MPLVDFDPEIPTFAVVAAQILENLENSPNAATNATDLSALMGGGAYFEWPNDSTSPVNIGFYRNGNTLLIYLGGLQSVISAERLAFGYLHPDETPRPGPEHTRVGYWADAVQTKLASRGVVTLNNVVVVGHSLGGFIGMQWAQKYVNRSIARNVRVCTFGCPKSVINPLQFTVIDKLARWVNPADNVPRLPAHPTYAGNMYATTSSREFANVQKWRHPCKALQVDNNGVITVIDDAPSSALGFSSLLTAFTSRAAIFGDGHALTTYITLLNKAVVIYNTPPLPVVPAAPIGGARVVAAPPIAISPAFAPPGVPPVVNRNNLTTLRSTMVDRDSIPTVIPLPNMVKVIKENNLYYVEWMGVRIALGPTKKKCRALARHLNRFLKLFQGTGYCASPEFVAALADYLRVAADPTNGFRPLLADNGNPAIIEFV